MVCGAGTASAWVIRHSQLIQAGRVLDVACGHGRNLYPLLGLGLELFGVDRDAAAFEQLEQAGVHTLALDLEREGELIWPFEDASFSALIVCNYLHRPLFPRLLKLLAPGGVMIYETFAVGNEKFGKPSRAEFLLKEGELLQLIASSPAVAMEVIAYESGYVDVPRPAQIQRICARRQGGAKQLNRLA
ncbi:class I SAM-dependent methyltransferase [Undibacterium crateris]|uniref:class I SAM-dependent methyltransferase n=1 Tax=Undibacterium crateris TaxID=2528175 RepID=UPI001389B5CE|nr:class I SAM-dependent methyltransferase [Undibacterium crateris]NDI84437.1 methyltransferase domain-containing protein [Undibacterium crateris]